MSEQLKMANVLLRKSEAAKIERIEALEELREKLERDTSKAKLYPTAPIKHAFAEGATIEGYRAIADAIEAEIAERFMELPLDADGMPIRIGDTVCEVDVRVPIEVMSLTFYEDCVDVNVCGMNPNLLRHVKPRTLEDVLREFTEKYQYCISDDGRSITLAEYAAEIRELLGVGV